MSKNADKFSLQLQNFLTAYIINETILLIHYYHILQLFVYLLNFLMINIISNPAKLLLIQFYQKM